MIKDAFLFYYVKSDPVNTYKIKNIALRNRLPLEYRPYYTEDAWKEFLRASNSAYRNLLVSESISIDENFKGFVLLYTDPILNKQRIIINTNDIIELLD